MYKGTLYNSNNSDASCVLVKMKWSFNNSQSKYLLMSFLQILHQSFIHSSIIWFNFLANRNDLNNSVQDEVFLSESSCLLWIFLYNPDRFFSRWSMYHFFLGSGINSVSTMQVSLLHFYSHHCDWPQRHMKLLKAFLVNPFLKVWWKEQGRTWWRRNTSSLAKGIVI